VTALQKLKVRIDELIGPGVFNTDGYGVGQSPFADDDDKWAKRQADSDLDPFGRPYGNLSSPSASIHKTVGREPDSPLTKRMKWRRKRQ
jgi:hypothetical protein